MSDILIDLNIIWAVPLKHMRYPGKAL